MTTPIICRKHVGPVERDNEWYCARCGQRVCGARTKLCETCGEHKRHHTEDNSCTFVARRHLITALMKNGRCRVHGGATPTGSNSATWKGGSTRWWREQGLTQLANRFEATLNDPKLVDLRQEAAILDVMYQDEVMRWARGASDEAWPEVQTEISGLNEALASQDIPKARRHMTRIAELGATGADRAKAQVMVLDLIERKRRLVESYFRGILVTSKVYTEQQIVAMVGALTSAIRNEVQDPTSLARIFSAFDTLFNQQALPGETVEKR